MFVQWHQQKCAFNTLQFDKLKFGISAASVDFLSQQNGGIQQPFHQAQLYTARDS
jgi:hypothetical protein